MLSIVVSKRHLLIALIVVGVLAFSFAIFPLINVASSPKGTYTIVLDAGHGGIDGGCVGRITGTAESYLNLKYAKDLEERLESFGFRVIMTRKDMNGLYSPFAPNKKKSDMKKRKEIIESSGADLLLSIHMNSFPTKSSKGAQAFYKKGSEAGREFASAIQRVLNETVENAKKTPGEGDYFILNCTEKPGVLVECGFLSNPAEEEKLISDSYMHEFNSSLIAGIFSFIGK